MSDTQKPLPLPQRFANFKGDARGQIGQEVGPNTLGETLIVVDEHFDAEANTTHKGYAFLGAFR